MNLKNLSNIKESYQYHYLKADDDPESSGIVQGIEECIKFSTILTWRNELDPLPLQED